MLFILAIARSYSIYSSNELKEMLIPYVYVEKCQFKNINL